MNIYIAADHRGFQLKQFLIEKFKEFTDLGAFYYDPDDDYPDLAQAVCSKLAPEDKAILICGSGHGMDIAANRFSQIRAILGFNSEVVKQGRAHEDANILVLPSDWTTNDQAIDLTTTFINTPFSNEARHLRRLSKLANIGQ